ncbi:hypothetical protein C8F01DRAFT_976474, partial [Mycena amicta]
LLYGLGGAGKTQTALKFIAGSGSRFTHQFKIHASSKETIQAGYKQLAVDKKLRDSTAEAAETWLQANQEEWLILFDNADNRDLNLGEYLPKCGHGNILITSRNPELWALTGPQKRAIQISDLSIDDAALLLLNRAGLELETNNKEHAAVIAKELHCFPLAIVQAGAFIGKSPRLKKDISGYIPLYQKNKAALLSEKPGQSTEDYEETVYTTWKMSFSRLAEVEPLAAQFLQLCSFIHCDGIVEDIFERASTYIVKGGPLDPTQDALQSSLEFLSLFRNDDKTWNSLLFERITSELHGYSLMAWQNGTYSIHPLVHYWSRTTITDVVSQRKLMVNLLGMAAACSSELMQEIQLLLHLVHLSKEANILGTGFESNFGSVFWTGGMFSRAEALQSYILTTSQTLLGIEHPGTLHAMAGLATTYQLLGRYTDAEQLEEQVLKIQTKLLGTEHPDTISAMARLAETYRYLGRYTNAEQLDDQVLTQRTKLIGPEHPDTITAMANLAATYHRLGRYTNAEQLDEQVLKQRTKLLGTEHPHTIQAMAHLAATYHSLGQYNDAEDLRKQVLKQRTKVLGAEHPDTITAMANLAATHHRLRWYTDAEKLREDVLKQITKLFGPEHPDTITAMANLAATYSCLKRHTDAVKLRDQVLQERSKLLGAEHPHTITAMASLAATYCHLKRYIDAEKLQKQVLKQRTKLLGIEHPHTITAMADLAATYIHLGQYTDAKQLQDEVLKQRTKLLGTKHPRTIHAMAHLATTYHHLGQYDDAEKLRKQVREK